MGILGVLLHFKSTLSAPYRRVRSLSNALHLAEAILSTLAGQIAELVPILHPNPHLARIPLIAARPAFEQHRLANRRKFIQISENHRHPSGAREF